MPRITITAPDQNSQPYRFQLDREVVSLGRGSENDIVIDSGSVSTHHAEMRRVLGGYELHDLGSTNGTKLDGVRYPVVPLAHGSVVHLGDVSFEISLTDEEQAMLLHEVPVTTGYGGYAAPAAEAPRSTQPIGYAPTPAPAPRPVPQRQVIVMQQEEGGGFMMGIVMIILAVVAFGAGASIRHQKETGKQLLQSMKEKKINQAKQAPPAPTTEVPPAVPQPPVPPPVMPAAPPLPSSGGGKPDLPKP